MPLSPTTYTPTYEAPAGGGELHFYLTEAQHTAWLAATHQTGTGAAGWYEFFKDLAGGTMTPGETRNEVRNEKNNLVAETVSDQEIVIANGSIASDPVIRYTLEWLKGQKVPARYLLSVTPEGQYDTVSTPGSTFAEIHGYYEVKVRSIGATNTAAAEQRSLPFEIVATIKDGETRIAEYAIVDLEETQVNWPSQVQPWHDDGTGSSS